MSGEPLVELESSPCPLGCPPGDRVVLEGRDRLHGVPGEFRVVECRTCGLKRTDPRPTRRGMAPYYPGDYGPHQDRRGEDPRRTDLRPAWRRALGSFVWRLADSRAEWLPPVGGRRLLEMGCASGAFLQAMARRGYEVEGIEASEQAAARARSLGLVVRTGWIEDLSDPSEPYDVAVGWMVLEHLHEPLAALEKLRTWTAPGGWLALSVPDAGALEAAVFRSAWYALDLPRHLYHFDRRTLTRLLDRAGWRLRRVVWQRSAMNLLASAGYALRDAGASRAISDWLVEAPERPGRLPLLLFPLALGLGTLRQSGRMTIWAQRSDA